MTTPAAPTRPRASGPRAALADWWHDASVRGSEQLPFTEMHARRLGRIRRYFYLHPRVLDLLLTLLVVVPSLLLDVLGPVSLGETFRPLAIAVILLSGLVVLLRRAFPLAAVVLILALYVLSVAASGNGNGLELALSFCLYTLMTSRRPVVAWTAFGVGNIVTATALVLWGETSDVTFDETGEMVVSGTLTGGTAQTSTIVVTVLFTLLAIAIGASVRNRRERMQDFIDRANRLALEREQGDQLAVAAERTRIAREMHDVVAHSLQVMIALSDGARAQLRHGHANRATLALDELSATGRGAIGDMRRILGVLRSEGGAEFDPQPGEGDVPELVRRFRSAGLPVKYTYAGPELPADQALSLTIFRVLQESLTNVLRYCPQASEVHVQVEHGDGTIQVTVTNDFGPVRGTVRGAGTGLIGMRERVAAFGGTVEAGPYGGGWRVRATLHPDTKETR